MHCAACRHVNPAGAKFCNSCGGKLPPSCSVCGAIHSVAAKYCSDCGARLAAIAPATIETPQSLPTTVALEPSASGRKAERRQLTVMFCDLVGSVGHAARLDPEDMRELIAIYRACIANAVARFDGYIAQHLGDGVLVYFGYPRAHEDDAERAVRAGLAALAAVEDVKNQTFGQCEARVGIATGLVVVGEQIGGGDNHESLAIGETPNLAARLQAKAAPGDLIIDTGTRRLVGRLFDFHPLGQVEIKGLTRPVDAWRVRGERAGVGRFEALRSGVLFPLVGRQEEIDLLLRRWQQAKAGEGRVVVLSGEPGIGKSRIAETLLALLADKGHAPLRYFCSPHHSQSALHPFTSHIEHASGFESTDSVTQRLDKLEARVAPLAGDIARDMRLLAEMLSLADPAGRCATITASPQQKREMTLSLLVEHLAARAALAPILILFEDVHWIDPTSLDLLDRMVSRIARLPVLMIITIRPEHQPTWAGQPHVTILPLSRLDGRDSLAIVTGITNGKCLPGGVAEQVIARTDGVPLFIEEVTSTLLESGLLRETPDAYVLDGKLPPLAIPTTLQASLIARLDRLSLVKDVAQIGAVIGREFSYELISAAAGVPFADLDIALERLLHAGLITRSGTPPHATFAFRHALVQDAAYATLLKSRRQQLHANIGHLLTRDHPAQAESLPEIVAHHFTEAGLAGEAVTYWRKAAQRASGRWANREAAEAFTRALAVVDTLPQDRQALEMAFEIRLELRTMLNLLGDVQQMLDSLREAAAIAEQLDDDQRRGRIGAVMTNVYTNLGAFDEAIGVGDRALVIAERLGDQRLRLLTTSYLAQAHAHRSDYRRVVDLAADNLDAMPPEWVSDYFGRPAPVTIFDLYYLIISLAELGRFAEAASYEAKAIRLAEPMQQAFNSLGLAYYAASTLHLVKGDWEVAQSLIERVIDVLRAGKIVIMLPHAVAASAWITAQRGDLNDGLRRLREAEHLLERNAAHGIIGQRGGTYHMLGRACLLIGLLDEAQRFGEQAVEVSPRQPGFVCNARHLLGDIAAHTSRFDATTAEAHYRAALDGAEALALQPLIAHCHFGLGKLALRNGASQQAQGSLTVAKSMYAAMDMSYWQSEAEAAASAGV